MKEEHCAYCGKLLTAKDQLFHTLLKDNKWPIKKCCEEDWVKEGTKVLAKTLSK